MVTKRNGDGRHVSNIQCLDLLYIFGSMGSKGVGSDVLWAFRATRGRRKEEKEAMFDGGRTIRRLILHVSSFVHWMSY